MPSHAIHHLMQIRALVPSVYGDTSAQAIQLTMRSPGQNVMSGSRLRAYDATGSNPVLIFDFNTTVANGLSGDSILLTTEVFNSVTNPDIEPDFTMTNRIPDAYFPAGKLTFEEDDGTVLWSLAWGGSNYTGTNTGAITNDDDGNFGAAISGGLDNPLNLVVLLNLDFAEISTTNALNYVGVNSTLLQNNSRIDYLLDLRPRLVTITRPNAADALQAGESFKIKWNNQGSLGGKVAIDLFDGGTKIDSIVKKKKNSGKYAWSVPHETPGGSNYRVRVRDKETGTSDQSETFTINAH